MSGGCGEKFAALVNLHSAQKSGFDYTHKVASRIGRKFVAVIKLCGINLEAGIRIPDHEVGIAARSDRPFLVRKTR